VVKPECQLHPKEEDMTQPSTDLINDGKLIKTFQFLKKSQMSGYFSETFLLLFKAEAYCYFFNLLFILAALRFNLKVSHVLGKYSTS
jgi:hypothetical protein